MAAPYAGPTVTDLAPDPDTAWKWISWWFHGCTSGMIELGWMVPHTGQLTAFRRFKLEDESILDAMMEINEVPGQALYVRAGTVAPDTPLGRTTDRFILQAGGLWLDLDTPEQVAHAMAVNKDPATRLHPGGFVCTGKLPTPRYQLYVRAGEPINQPELLRTLNLRLRALYGGDAVMNPSRLMRLPGSIAWPYKPGRVPELTTFAETTQPHPGAYDLDSLTDWLPQLTNGEDHAPAQITAGPTSILSGITRESQLIAQITAGRGGWHNTMIELVGIWLNTGMSNAAILLAAHAFTQTGYTLAQTQREMRAAIDGGRRKWNLPEQDHLVPSAPHANRVLNLDELAELPDPSWLLHNIIPKNSLVVPYGPPKAGKSFILLSIGLHIAAGLPWFSKPVAYGGVVYIAGEGVGGLKHRVKAMLQSYEIQSLVPFWIVPRAVNFRVAADVASLVTAIKERIAISDFPDVPVTLAIVDTLARAMPGADENSAQDVGVVIAACDWLKEELNCAVAIVHHEGKDEGRGARGTSALRGAWDAAFRITKTKSQITMEVVDQKDAESGEKLTFDLREVAVGRIGRSSLVPWLAETTADQDTRERPYGQVGMALEILENIMTGPDSAILPPAPDRPVNVRGTHIDRWRQAVYAKLATMTQTARRQAFGRAFNALQQDKWIVSDDPWIWLPSIKSINPETDDEA